MPSAAPSDLPLTELAPGYTTHFANWGGMTVVFDRLTAGQDVSSMLKDLPDGQCQAHHWGFLLKGRALVDYGTHEETIEAGHVYYVSPGHRFTVIEDSEAVEFTSVEDLEVTLSVMRNQAPPSSRDDAA